jgi:nitrogen fixation/metabolism regulation signal transduction histidine kinase
MVIIPVSIVYLVSVIFLTKSINSWFDVKVESALEGGLSLGQKTLNILMKDIELKSRSIAYTIGNTEEDQRDIVLRDMREKFNLEEVVIYDRQLNILALTSANDSQIPSIPNNEDIERSTNDFYGVVEEINDRILLRAYMPIILNKEITLDNIFLEIKQPIPSEISSLAISVESVYEDYERLAYSRKSLNIIYALTLTLVLLLAILSAVAISLVISRRFSEPLSQLANATREISKGNFKKTIPEKGEKDELGLLVKSFNSMTKQLDSATRNAEENQHRLELSRMFLDTILTNLSSGVIVINEERIIRHHNPAGLKTLQIRKKIFKIIY